VLVHVHDLWEVLRPARIGRSSTVQKDLTTAELFDDEFELRTTSQQREPATRAR